MSISWGAQYPKLKTNLRLAINRLKLMGKKKTEMAMKARTEIADYIAENKADRARIRVEHIIREDYLVEAFEILEMYCDLLLARFGLIEQMKTLDDGIAEAVISIIWAAPRIATDIAEFKTISDQLTIKYGKPFAEAARANQLEFPAKVSPKLISKLSVAAPPKLLVERYMIEIAASAGVPFVPDPDVMRDDEVAQAEKMLIDFKQAGSAGQNTGPSGSHIYEVPSIGPPPPQYDGINDSEGNHG
uniref:IST1 homolog n=1 Tax=Angiostrongylus cantonensis TaxID=6313 RepID=A0A0K0CU47_ANGCA